MTSSLNKKPLYLKNFGTCIDEFIKTVEDEFPNDVDVKYAKNGIATIKKSNPRVLVEYWLKYVYIPNKDKIHNGDVSFIIDGDHRVLDGFDGGAKVKDALFRLKDPISKLNKDLITKLATYILNMSKLSVLYFS